MTTINPSKELAKTLEENATILTDGTRKFYYLPFWFESENGNLFMYSFDHLPKTLKDLIEKNREV